MSVQGYPAANGDGELSGRLGIISPARQRQRRNGHAVADGGGNGAYSLSPRGHSTGSAQGPALRMPNSVGRTRSAELELGAVTSSERPRDFGRPESPPPRLGRVSGSGPLR